MALTPMLNWILAPILTLQPIFFFIEKDLVFVSYYVLRTLDLPYKKKEQKIKSYMPLKFPFENAPILSISLQSLHRLQAKPSFLDLQPTFNFTERPQLFLCLIMYSGP